MTRRKLTDRREALMVLAGSSIGSMLHSGAAFAQASNPHPSRARTQPVNNAVDNSGESSVLSIGLRSLADNLDVPSGISCLVSTGFSRVGIGEATYILTQRTGTTPARFRVKDGRWFEIGDTCLLIEQFGSDVGFDNPDRDTEALAQMLQAGTELARSCHLSSKTYYINRFGFSVDFTRTCLVGQVGSVLDFSRVKEENSSSSAVVSAFWLASSGGERVFRSDAAIANITLVGPVSTKPGSTSFVAFRSGNPAVPNSGAAIWLDRLRYEGWNGHHLWDSNTFMFLETRSHMTGWSGCSVRHVQNPSSYGENMVFDQCVWNDPVSQAACLYEIEQGAVTFRDCSLDYLPSIGRSWSSYTPSIHIEGGHIEYSFPHKVRAPDGSVVELLQSGPMFSAASGRLSISRATLCMIGGGAIHPMILAQAGVYSGGAISISPTVQRLTSFDYRNNCLYIISREAGSQFNIDATGLRSLMPLPDPVGQKMVFPYQDFSELPMDLDAWTLQQGSSSAVSSYQEPEHGKVFSIDLTVGPLVLVSPVVPITGFNAIFSEYSYLLKATSLIGGEISLALIATDAAGKPIHNGNGERVYSKPHGLVVLDNATKRNIWTTVVPAYPSVSGSAQFSYPVRGLRLEIAIGTFSKMSSGSRVRTH